MTSAVLPSQTKTSIFFFQFAAIVIAALKASLPLMWAKEEKS